MSRAGFVLLILLSFAVPAVSQTLVDHAVWITPTAQGRFEAHSRWRWSAESSIRTRKGIDALNIIIVRGVVSFDVTKTSNLGMGYGEVFSFLDGGAVQHEHRLFQQYIWNTSAAGATVTLRTRFEERSLAANSSWAFRVREQLRYSRPIKRGPYLVIGWDEIAFHTNATVRTDRGFDQNRAFGGVGRIFGTRGRIEAGYLRQYLHSVTGPNRMNHALATTLNVAF